MAPSKAAPADALLRAMLRETAHETLVFDADTLALVETSAAAARNLGYPQSSLRRMRLTDCLDAADAGVLPEKIAALRHGKRRLVFAAHCRRHDGSLYPVEVRLTRVAGTQTCLWQACAPSRSQAEDLRAVFAHLPGMAYQVLRQADGTVTLPYVSAQSAQLLGIKAASLCARPERFAELIHAADKPDYLARLAEAGGVPMSFNWEGRIHIQAWKDVKWVNLRVRRRDTPEGTLWDGIMLNVTRSKEAEAEIRRQRTQMAALTAHVETVKEQERLNLAREVHDDLGGNLTAIKIGLSWLLRRLPEEQHALIKRTAYLDNVVDQTIEATHRIAASLRPPVLDFGIVSAIEWQIRRFGHTTGIACAFDAPAEAIPLEADAAIAVFRIVQEALTNVAKHAQATRARVALALENGTLVATVTDNGQGMRAETPKNGTHGFGVLGMTERAAALGGILTVSPAPRRGTRVTLRVPLAAGK